LLSVRTELAPPFRAAFYARVRRQNPSFQMKTSFKEHPSEGPSGALTASTLPARGNRGAIMRKPRSTHPGKVDAEARILAGAAEMFANFGYNGVSTRDIATEANVNEVTIYRHYPRKRDLYVAVLDAELQQVKLRGDLLAGIADAGNAETAVERTFELIASTMTQRPELLRLVQYSALELSEDIDSLLRRHLGQYVEVIARYLEPWVSRGELKCSSAKAFVLTLVAIILSHRSLHRLFSGDGSPPEVMIKAYTEFSIKK
jgi:AcrR family transcriptional regulator